MLANRGEDGFRDGADLSRLRGVLACAPRLQPSRREPSTNIRTIIIWDNDETVSWRIR
jgi:hypothetical protein